MYKINKHLSSLALIGRFSRRMTRLPQMLRNVTPCNTNSRYRNPVTLCFHLPRPPAALPPITKPTQSAVPMSARRILQLGDPLLPPVCAPVAAASHASPVFQNLPLPTPRIPYV